MSLKNNQHLPCLQKLRKGDLCCEKLFHSSQYFFFFNSFEDLVNISKYHLDSILIIEQKLVYVVASFQILVSEFVGVVLSGMGSLLPLLGCSLYLK